MAHASNLARSRILYVRLSPAQSRTLIALRRRVRRVSDGHEFAEPLGAVVRRLIDAAAERPTG